MRTKQRVLFSLAIGGLLFTALPSAAQQVKERVLQGNPYRQIGGSCVYGRNGELLHAPKGAKCASREDEAPGANAAQASERFAGLPPALRAEANALMESHAHVADDLAELRRAVAQGEKAKALGLSDEVVKELLAHMNREQALYEKLAKEHASH